MPDEQVVSIIVVSWNTKGLLKRCLDSIYATVLVPFEVLVVDNASDDGSAEMVESGFPEATLIRSAVNLGFSAANNLGIRQAHGEFVMLLNPDTVLLPGAVAGMLHYMNGYPDVGLIGPRLIMPDGQLQQSGRRFPGLLRELMGITRVSRLFGSWYDEHLNWGRTDFGKTVEVDEVSGACMLIRKSVLDQVGLLDERFFMYYEDVDLCYRLKKAGWKVVYMGEVEIIHVWAQGALKAGILHSSGVMYHSQYLYFRKHHGLIPAIILRTMSQLLLWALRMKYAIIPPKVGKP